MKKKWSKIILLIAVAIICMVASTVILHKEITAQAATATPKATVTKKTLYVGYKTYTIKLTNKAAKAKVTYSSSNKKIATVSKKGVVSPVKKGTAKVVVKITQSGRTYSSVITVSVKNPYISFTSKRAALEVGEVFAFSAKGYGLGKTNLQYSTSDTEVAVIDAENGELKAVGNGIATVKAIDCSSGKKISYRLTVTGGEIDKVTYGIDAAKWQGVIDWGEVKASGIEFAIIRVGYRTQVTGEILEDPNASYNLQQARDNGIKIGVYFFSTAVNEQEAKEEAEWVADFIAPYPITYPVAYNCEGFKDEDNRQYGLGLKERTAIACTFLDLIESKGYTPMFYAAKNELELNSDWNTEVISEKYKTWVAQYPAETYEEGDKSTYSGQHAMWQYTAKGLISGIDNAVDLNIAYFGYDMVAKAKDDTPQEVAVADPEALINFKEVKETVTAKYETNLRTVPSSTDPETIVLALKNGENIVRTGIGSNGWSRVEVNGQTLYAVTSLLKVVDGE
ncbi:MAG TPA: GH25 family lysozyme [Mobilitalea sp.]|nr:GH25 family lysozyme [Mobilitalea sp.]